jgi:hypothetical protein
MQRTSMPARDAQRMTELRPLDQRLVRRLAELKGTHDVRTDEFRWLLDGQVWQIQKEWGTENGKFPQPFDQPFHLVFNLAVGGQFVGAVADETPFPAKMLVDWVRVSQPR